MKHLNIRVKGKVQGVFFRASTKEKADGLNLSGFVRNEPSGDVQIEAEGTSEQLEELIAWCRKGPSRAEVEQIIIEEGEIEGYKKFEVIQ